MKKISLIFLIYFLCLTAPNSSFAKGQIPNLMPSDVYLNMEKQGFETKKLFTKYGNSWVNKKNYAGIDYEVSTYTSSGVSSVEEVSATAMIDITQKNIVATLPFFTFISSLPYQGSNPQKAGKWLKDNFNKKRATTVMGGVKFTLSSPTIAFRMLTIEKDN